MEHCSLEICIDKGLKTQHEFKIEFEMCFSLEIVTHLYTMYFVCCVCDDAFDLMPISCLKIDQFITFDVRLSEYLYILFVQLDHTLYTHRQHVYIKFMFEHIHLMRVDPMLCFSLRLRFLVVNAECIKHISHFRLTDFAKNNSQQIHKMASITNRFTHIHLMLFVCHRNKNLEEHITSLDTDLKSTTSELYAAKEQVTYYKGVNRGLHEEMAVVNQVKSMKFRKMVKIPKNGKNVIQIISIVKLNIVVFFLLVIRPIVSRLQWQQ